MVLYSIVIPVHNEGENIKEVVEKIYGIWANTDNFEIIVVNDASTDNTLETLSLMKSRHRNLHIINLKKRFGQSGALYVGLKLAKAPVIITLDGDMQNPPEEIPKLISKFNEGYDFVIGIRKGRQDSMCKKIASRIANLHRRLILGDKFQDIGCSLRVFKKELIECIFPFKSLHRFLPYLALIHGFKIAQIEVKHNSRRYGKTKYGIWGRFCEGLSDLKGMDWLKRRRIGYKELFNESNIEFI